MSQTNEIQDPLRSSIGSWVQKMLQFEKSHKWAVCPSCKEQWTKLKPCSFKWDGKWTRDALCVQCGETVKAIHHVADRFPIMGVDIDVGCMGPRYTTGKINGEVFRETLWRNHYATVRYGALVIGITSTSHGAMMVKVGEEEPKVIDNILAAWSLVEDAIGQFTKP